jgi:hypothetical protein
MNSNIDDLFPIKLMANENPSYLSIISRSDDRNLDLISINNMKDSFYQF